MHLLRQARDQVAAVEARVVGQDGGELAQGVRERGDGEGFLARDRGRERGDRVGHADLGVAAAEGGARVEGRLREHGEGVVEAAFRFVEEVFGGAA